MPDKYEALSQLRITKQCPARWSHMVGDDQVRHCSKCDRNVYNISEMTRDEALRLIEAHEGKLCTRFYSRSDGTIMTKDCGFVPRLGMKISGAVGALLSLVGFVAFPVVAQGATVASPSVQAKIGARELEWGLKEVVDDAEYAATQVQMSKKSLKRAAERMDQKEQ